jgi:hypothetical protein
VRTALGTLLAACLIAALPQSAAAQGCITKLPVNHQLKSPYTVSYKKGKIAVRVMSTGSWIHHTKAELYTFGGVLVAKSKLYRGGFNKSKKHVMKLLFGTMQSGKYTLIITGEPNSNRSCGPKKYTKVVEFSDCPKSLPVEFPDPPGGKAGDYGHWLSIFLRPLHGVLRGVVVELYDADDNFFGKAKLKALFGTAKVDIELRHKLLNGTYTVIVRAKDGLPRACGKKRAKKVLTFGKHTGGGGGGGDDDGGGFGGGGEPGFGDGEGFDPDSGFGGGDTDGGDGTEA